MASIWKNGYAGSLAWSYHAEDSSSDFGSAAKEFSAWSKAHKEDVYIDLNKLEMGL